MLLNTVIRKLKLELPLLNLILDKEKHKITISAIYEGFGNIELDDDEDEITLFVGNFTHCHFGCNQEYLSEKEKAEMVAEEVVEFLNDLFNEKVTMYGSHGGGGGFKYRDERKGQESRLDMRQRWLWSGPISE